MMVVTYRIISYHDYVYYDHANDDHLDDAKSVIKDDVPKMLLNNYNHDNGNDIMMIM